MNLPNTFLTVREIAKLLKLNPLTVYGYIREGKLKAAKFGRYYRVSSNDLQAFIENHKV